MEKFYYIDKEGNKKKYVGKIISNKKSYNGILTTVNKVAVDKKLEYHPEIEAVEGYSSYYTYTNASNEDVIYLDIIKRDENNDFYFTYNEKNIYNLIYHPETKPIEEYYTYLDADGNEQQYSGNIFYDKGTKTYYGFIDK